MQMELNYKTALLGAAGAVAAVAGFIFIRASGASSRNGIPAKMKALRLIKCEHGQLQAISAFACRYIDQTDTKADLSKNFEVAELDTPVPKSGQILVKIERSPINPSDLSSLAGTYK